MSAAEIPAREPLLLERFSEVLEDEKGFTVSGPLINRVARRVLDVLGDLPLAHLETYSLELIHEGVDALYAGDEPAEGGGEALLDFHLISELEARGALNGHGGLLRPTGWPHKAVVALEGHELAAVIAALTGGPPAPGYVLERLEREVRRVESGRWHGFPPPQQEQPWPSGSYVPPPDGERLLPAPDESEAPR